MDHAIAAADPRPAAAVPGGTAGRRGSGDGGFAVFGADGLTFFDVLDVINPLQHIPVISTLYRHLTGDVLDPLPRIAGGALFGGVAGAISAAVNVAIEAISGQDIGGHVLAAIEDVTDRGDPVRLAGAGASAIVPAPDPATPGAPAYVAGRTGPDPFVILDRARRDRAYASVLTTARTAAEALAVPKRAGEVDTAIRGLTRLDVEA